MISPFRMSFVITTILDRERSENLCHMAYSFKSTGFHVVIFEARYRELELCEEVAHG
jgi:hypothetical protein